jgi:ribonucleotide monophosphatase NagD (HAD superfamily)
MDGVLVHEGAPRPRRGLVHRPPQEAGTALPTGVEPYFLGKPNPLMMRSALRAIEAHSEDTARSSRGDPGRLG